MARKKNKKETSGTRIAGRIGQIIGDIENFFLGRIGARIEALPDFFPAWLIEHGFWRREGKKQVADPAGFAGWIRNGFFSLFALVALFQLYPMVLGTLNDDGNLLTPLYIGLAIFAGLWAAWIIVFVRKLSVSAAVLSLLGTLLLGALLLGPAIYQYCNPRPFPPFGLTEQHMRELYAAGIPRYWAVLGFILTTLVVLPFVWMLRLGPVLISLATTETMDALKKVWSEITKLIPFRGAESQAAAARLTEQTKGYHSILMTAWTTLALVTATMLFSPTVWGLYGGMVIGMFAIIVYFIRESAGFIGYVLTKVLYGVAVGTLIFICVLYAVSLLALMMVPAWTVSKPLFWMIAGCLAVGLATAVFTVFDSTTRNEQSDFRSGRAYILSHKFRVVAPGDNSVTTEVAVSKPINWKFPSWTGDLLFWGLLGVGAYFYGERAWNAVIGLGILKGLLLLLLLLVLMPTLMRIRASFHSAGSSSGQEAHHGH